jgi:mono/diheme cytochrome c family protein
MRRFNMACAVMLGAASGAVAQGGPTLTQQQLEGRQLFQQSCGVCHTKPTLTSPLFGPALSKATFANGDEQPKTQIANGSPNMPGFKYHFTPAQIDAIVSYLKTEEAPAAEHGKPAGTPSR